MPITTTNFFTNVHQESYPSSGNVWVDLPNVLADPNEATNNFDSGFPFWYMVLDTPISGSQVPADSIVTKIDITITSKFYGNPGLIECNLNFISIAGGPEKTGPSLTDFDQVYSLVGDLAYWGITNQQALDFASGLEDFKFSVENTGGGIKYDVGVKWVKCQITYTPNVVPLPALF